MSTERTEPSKHEFFVEGEEWIQGFSNYTKKAYQHEQSSTRRRWQSNVEDVDDGLEANILMVCNADLPTSG
jgi:hypothetical protein